MDLLKNILEYERSIISKYISNRSDFIKILSELDLNQYNYDKLNVMIHDIKAIIEPIKTSNDAIHAFIENKQND
jgi:virulence-associated protein VagC